MRVIQLNNEPDQSQHLVLGGQSVRIDVWWQPTSEAWYMTLLLNNTVRVIAGRQMSIRRRLIGQRPSVFDGEFFVWPIHEGDLSVPRRRAWIDTHRLIYVTALESSVIQWLP